MSNSSRMFQSVYLLLCQILLLASLGNSQEECAAEFRLPKITGRHKIPIRLLFESEWQCYLTNPVDGKTIAFVESLTKKLQEVHGAAKWIEKIAVESFGNDSESVLRVDYVIVSSKKTTVRHQIEVAKNLYANVFDLGKSITLDGTALKLAKLPALLLENSEGRTVHAYVDEVYKNPCEIFIKSDTCDNGARCEVKDGLPYCRCIEGYDGAGCQTWKKEQERRALTILIILLVMMAFCITVFIFVTCVKSPLQFNLHRPMLRTDKKPATDPCVEFGSTCKEAPKVKLPPSPVKPPCIPAQIPKYPDIHSTLEIPAYKSLKKNHGSSFPASGDCLPITNPLIPPSGGTPCPMRPPAPVLLPLSEVPSARLSTIPKHDYLKITNKKYKLYKCGGKYTWKMN